MIYTVYIIPGIQTVSTQYVSLQYLYKIYTLYTVSTKYLHSEPDHRAHVVSAERVIKIKPDAVVILETEVRPLLLLQRVLLHSVYIAAA